MMHCTIRLAKTDDAAELLAVYTPFVVSDDRNISDVSFEYEAPTTAEFARRIENITAAYPYLVCECDGKLLGYAYAHPFIERAAYQWGAEVTIYLAPEGQGRGIGKILYTALEELLKLQGIKLLYACVTASNTHSVKMHEAMGYKIVGEFKNTGFKHGHWLDMVWLEKVIGSFEIAPQPLVNFNDIDKCKIEEVLARANEV